MSTRACLAATPLRMRVSMSEIGSVMSALSKNQTVWRAAALPGTLRDAGHVAFERQLPEAQAAHVELAHVGSRAAAQMAAVAVTDLVLQRLFFAGDFCRCSHSFAFSLWPLASYLSPEP